MNEQNLADGLQIHMTPDELAADHRPNMDPATDILLAEADDGGLLGYVLGSWAVRDGVVALSSEGAVRPSARRQGIGGELLRRAQARLAERTRDVEPERRRVFSSWVDDAQAGARALLEGDGHTAIRFSFEMARRGLGDLTEADLAVAPPDGIEIRPGSHEAVREILAAEDEAFHDHPGHRTWTEADTQGVLANPAYEPSLWRVAWDGDRIAGVVETSIYRDENERLGLSRGWLDRVSVRRPWRRRGLARALIASSFGALRERGIAEAWLGVDANNPTGALRLYEGLDFERMRSGRLLVRDAPR